MPLVFLSFSADFLADRRMCKRYIEEIVQRAAPRTKEMRAKNQHDLVKCDSERIVDLAQKNALSRPSFASPETVSSKVFSRLTKKMEKVYDAKTKCFFENVELANTPFLSVGEEIVSERFTYLAKPFSCHPGGTAAFVRKTNFAEYCFLIPGYIVQTGNKINKMIGSRRKLFRIEEPVFPSRVVVSTSLKDIAKLLGEGLLKGVGGNVASLIFGAIFPPDMTAFLDDVYLEIQRIVHDELTDVIIDQLNGRIYGIETWVRNTYVNLKASGMYDDEELSEMMREREVEIASEVIGPLREDRFSKPGICAFMIGAGMHLAIIQELAYIDPKSDPMSSAYIDVLKSWAKDYGDFADTTTDAILSDRLEMISVKSETYFDHGSGYFFNDYWCYDSFDQTSLERHWWYTDDKGDRHGDLQAADHAREDLQDHWHAVRADLLEEMSDPYAVADDWLKLIDDPLPSVF